MSKGKVTIARECASGHECRRRTEVQFYQSAHKACKDAYSDIRAGLATSRFPVLDEPTRIQGGRVTGTETRIVFLAWNINERWC